MSRNNNNAEQKATNWNDWNNVSETSKDIADEIVSLIPQRLDRHTAYELYVIRHIEEKASEGLKMLLRRVEHDDGIYLQMASEEVHVTDEPVIRWDEVMHEVAMKVKAVPRLRDVRDFERLGKEPDSIEQGIVIC